MLPSLNGLRLQHCRCAGNLNAYHTTFLARPERITGARVQATTKNRVDLCLRLEGQKPVERLRHSKLYENMEFEIRLTSTDEVGSEVLGWLQKAHEQNR